MRNGNVHYPGYASSTLWTDLFFYFAESALVEFRKCALCCCQKIIYDLLIDVFCMPTDKNGNGILVLAHVFWQKDGGGGVVK